MKYGLTIFKEEIATAVAQLLEVEASEVDVAEASQAHDADFAVPVFKFAKVKQQAPAVLAEHVAKNLEHESLLKTQAVNGFVNITVRPEWLALQLSGNLNDIPVYGETKEGEGKTVIVDYIGLNLSKPFSVGHLRPTVQGAALISLYRALGYTVVGDSHLGDWGTPFGMWVVGFKKWGSEEVLQKDGVYELGRLYVKFRQEAKENPELNDEAKAWLKKLEAGDEEAVELQKRFGAISIEHMNKVLDRLKIKADENLGESFFVEGAKKLIEEFLASGVATRNEDSSVIVDLSEFGIETPGLIEKSDGSLLYLSTDIETIRYRLERWKPVKILYSVGAEQQFHFKQLFAFAKKVGYECEYVHPWFGTIDEIDEDGKRTKMSSRRSVALLENLLDTAQEKAKEHIKNADIPEEDIAKIAVGAIKFSDFAQGRQTNILFDWDKMFSLQGFSGPYIQYAAVRVNSILNKQGSEAKGVLLDPQEYDWQAEKELLLLISKYPEVVAEAAHEYEPHKIAQFAFDLAQTLNRYYETTSIQDSEGALKDARLSLLGVVSKLFAHSLGLLGIEVPSKM